MARGYSERSVLLYLGSEVERMGESVDAAEETMRDAIRLCGDVLRSGYDYDSIDSVAAACLYLACERQEEPIALPDVADVARKPQKTVQHLSANLMGELGISPEPADPDPYLEEGVEAFGFDAEQAAECFELLERGKEANLHSGRAPTTVAGAILYAVAQKHRLRIKQQDIADFVNKTTVSIRNSYRDFLQLADDVPVDVLPPQTVDEAADRLREAFPAHPDTYADEAAELARSVDSARVESVAGLVGGAYVAVAHDRESRPTSQQIASAVGVDTSTVSKYYDQVRDDV